MPSKEVITFWLDTGAPISLLSFFDRLAPGAAHRIARAGAGHGPAPPDLLSFEVAIGQAAAAGEGPSQVRASRHRNQVARIPLKRRTAM
jgi:hypothetical protein